MFLLLLLYILLMFIWSWVCRMMYKFGFDGYIRLGMEIVKSDVISLIIREIPACPSVVCLSIQLNIWLSSVWLDIFHQNKCSPGVFWFSSFHFLDRTHSLCSHSYLSVSTRVTAASLWGKGYKHRHARLAIFVRTFINMNTFPFVMLCQSFAVILSIVGGFSAINFVLSSWDGSSFR